MRLTEWTNEHLTYVMNKGKFKRWFGSSLVVDKNGLPVPFYHSTDVTFNVNDFKPFWYVAGGYGEVAISI